MKPQHFNASILKGGDFLNNPKGKVTFRIVKNQDL